MDSQIVNSNSPNSSTEMTRKNVSSKNPSTSKFYQKLIQSCKYFFIKNPIIIVPELIFIEINERWYTQGRRFPKDRPNGISVYLNKITSKIWNIDLLIVRPNIWEPATIPPVVTSFVPKIYQCDATSIRIYEQMFFYNDLMVIASKCEMFHLSNVVIINNDKVVPEKAKNSFKTAVSLETIFKALPNVKIFEYKLPNNSLNIITTKTAKELLKIPHFLSLDKFEMSEIPETFDIKSFYSHIKENKKTKIRLAFSRQISDEYETQIQTIVNEIRETQNHDYKVPMIGFPGIILVGFFSWYHT
uniref:Uncharacterized protein n=1 Tax=Panagrolaimus davidi TaxID=227884 RepID=A0A914P4C6_9BILA